MKIAFLGDISLNDNYIQLYKEGVNPFEVLEPLLQKSSFVVGNLECIAKGDFGENTLKQPRLTTTIETLNYLKNLNLKVACLAQNHLYDHLIDGFNKTTAFLKENNIQYLGVGNDSNTKSTPVIIEQDGIRVGILNYVSADTNPNMPIDAEVVLNMFVLANCINDIKELKQHVDFVVISIHWGGRVEGGLYPDWDQPKNARTLIDAGADLIIGHHSHTFQPYEKYKGKFIFYSLGNFCFSDYWFNNELNIMPERRMISTIIEVNFEADRISVMPDFYFNRMTYFEHYPNYSKIVQLRNLNFSIMRRIKPYWQLYYLHKRTVLPFVLFFKRSDLSFYQKIYRLVRYIRKKIVC